MHMSHINFKPITQRNQSMAMHFETVPNLSQPEFQPSPLVTHSEETTEFQAKRFQP